MNILDNAIKQFEILDFSQQKINYKTPCVYCWYNKINKKIYIGSAKTLSIRFSSYIREFTKGNGRRVENIRLVRSVKKYGLTNFLFLILEKDISLETLIMREQFYLDTYQPHKKNIGYNFSPTARNMLGYKFPQSRKDAISKRMRGNNPNARFKKEDIIKIFKLLSENIKKSEICKLFNINNDCLLSIQNRYAYGWVEIDQNILEKAQRNKDVLWIDKDMAFKIGKMLNNKIHPDIISKELNIKKHTIMSINKGQSHREVLLFFAPNDTRIFHLKRFLTKEEKSEILRLLDSGLTGKEIAKIYKISDDEQFHIRTAFRKKHGIIVPKRTSKYKGIYTTLIKGLWSAYIYNPATRKQIFVGTSRDQDALFEQRKQKAIELGLKWN